MRSEQGLSLFAKIKEELMSSLSIDSMRQIVSDQYDNFTWRRRVELMPDRQIAAIYFSWLGSGKLNKKNCKARENRKFHQMDIFEFLPEEKEKLGGYVNGREAQSSESR